MYKKKKNWTIYIIQYSNYFLLNLKKFGPVEMNDFNNINYISKFKNNIINIQLILIFLTIILSSCIRTSITNFYFVYLKYKYPYFLAVSQSERKNMVSLLYNII